MQQSKTCLIVGAGLAGLTAAGILQTNGWQVRLLDKGRGVGGRMATRRIDQSRFDHGAQFFTVRDPRFQETVNGWLANGWAKQWFSEGGHVRYRGTQGMNGIAKEMAQAFDVRIDATVQQIEHVDAGWRLRTQASETFEAAALLLTPPAEQSLALLATCSHQLPAEITSTLKTVAYDPCFALMATLSGGSNVPAPGYVRPESGIIGYLSDNTQKGISSGPSALTIHARGDFSRQSFELDKTVVAQMLIEAAQPWFKSDLVSWQIHRWKYSQPTTGCPEACLFTNQPAPLAIAGDGFGGARIEGAFLSGLAAAHQLLAAS